MSYSKLPPKTASSKIRIRGTAGADDASNNTKAEANALGAAMASTGPKPPARAKTKQDAVLAILSQPQGATIAAVMQTTGWQPHSVGGFLTAMVRKKLGLTLLSEKTGS